VPVRGADRHQPSAVSTLHPRAWTSALIVAAYVVVGAVMLAPITSYRHLDTAAFGADTRLNIWALAWVNHAVLDGASLFNANIFFPASNALAYSEHLLSISVFTLPVYAATRNPVLAYNLAWLLSYLSCGLAAHALAWRVTRDHVASFVGGVAYAFCFYRMLHGHAHIQLLWACWIPLSLLLLDGWWRDPSWRRLAWLWLVVLMQVLASWYLAVMVLVADALLATWLCFWRRPRREARVAMALQITLAAAAGAAVVWPIARHYTFLIGLNGQSPAEALGGAAAIRDLVVPPINTWLGQWLARQGSGAPGWIWGEKTLFLGYVTLALGALGLARARWPRRVDAQADGRDAAVWLGFFALLGGIALALSLGPSPGAVRAGSSDWTPFGLFSAVPGMTLFRVPARFVQLVTLALAIFAAAGAEALRARLGRAGRVITLILVPIMLGEWYLVDFPGGPPQPENVPVIYRQLATRTARAIVSLPEYVGGPEWFMEADYQYYSTVHWHPIVNGYSRTEPQGYRERMARIAAFPDADSARTLRAEGVDYLILHSKRYRDGATARIEAAKSSPDFTLVGQSGPDYLFRVVAPKR
jgi:hypothetical protein